MALDKVTAEWGELLFTDADMQERLSRPTYKQLKQVIDDGAPLDLDIANEVAHAMKEWALEKGATHFTHWFQPLTGITSEKHDGFLTPRSDGSILMAFSGKAISSAGFYASAVTAAQLLSKLASSVLTPILNMILSLSVCTGISSRFSLGGITDTLSKWFKYGITFAVSIFSAILGLNGTLSASADTVASRAARFGLSSFIPLIGSSISEAYGALQNSVSLLKSGVGVLVILALFVTFVPLLIKTLLWSAVLSVAKMTGEVLSVSSAVSVLHSLIQFISALRAVLIAVMVVFIISTSIMLRIGGQS